MLRKTKTVLAIFSVLAIFTACGKANYGEIAKKANEFHYSIVLSVDISTVQDSFVLIKTNEFTIDESAHSITIKGPSLISSEDNPGSYAIKFDGVATFSFPFGGRLYMKDIQTGHEINLEKYDNLRTKQEKKY